MEVVRVGSDEMGMEVDIDMEVVEVEVGELSIVRFCVSKRHTSDARLSNWYFFKTSTFNNWILILVATLKATLVQSSINITNCSSIRTKLLNFKLPTPTATQ